MRAPFLVCLGVAGFFALPAAAQNATNDVKAETGFRCPGTDPLFFEEIQKNGWIGFGETWDFNTCDEGDAIYFPGTTRRWKAFRRMPRAPVDEADVAFYSTIFPIGAFGSLGGIFAIAWFLGVVQRRKKMPYVVLACPQCETDLRVPASDTQTHSMFCPVCGGACKIVEGT